jgi:hypothetical protein
MHTQFFWYNRWLFPASMLIAWAVTLLAFAIVPGTPPHLTSEQPAYGQLLPSGTFALVLDYADADHDVDATTPRLELLKRTPANGRSADLAPAHVSFGGVELSITRASFPLHDLSRGRYRRRFSVADTAGHWSINTGLFLVDTVNMTVSPSSIDLGTLSPLTASIANSDVTVSVSTVGAPYRASLSSGSLYPGQGLAIPNWDGAQGWGYTNPPQSPDLRPVTGAIIASGIADSAASGALKTTTTNLKLGALIDAQQAAWAYTGTLSFHIDLDYKTGSTLASSRDHRWAWSYAYGWIDFDPVFGDVALTSTKMTGAAWSSSTGWINLAPTNSGVTVTCDGTLAGHAWSPIAGYLGFSTARADANGYLHGRAIFADGSVVRFDGASYHVRTAWTPSCAPNGGLTIASPLEGATLSGGSVTLTGLDASGVSDTHIIVTTSQGQICTAIPQQNGQWSCTLPATATAAVTFAATTIDSTGDALTSTVVHANVTP